jgi:SSS family solute:Na+ symporter
MAAKRGVLLAVVFWIMFDTLTTLTAMYASIEFRADDPASKGAMLFPLLGNHLLPSGMKGIFFAGMFGAIIAATVGYTFVSGTTISRDFMARIRRVTNEATITLYTRLGIAFAAVLGVVLATTVASVVDLWYNVASLIIPGLLVPVVGAYALKKPPSPGTAVATLTIPTAVAGAWIAFPKLAARLEDQFLSTEAIDKPSILTPIIVGILIALVIWGIGSVAERKNRT